MSADVVAVYTVQTLSSLRFGHSKTPLFDPAISTSTDVMTSDAFTNGCSCSQLGALALSPLSLTRSTPSDMDKTLGLLVAPHLSALAADTNHRGEVIVNGPWS
jgi:hypothetical protein